MIVSFLIPTRGRIQSLLDSIQSIKDKASPDVQLEFLVRIDDNDYETLAARDRISGEIVVGPRWLGYDSISIFANELAAKSHGDWLIGWNDDTFMQTHHWDKLLPPADRAQIIWFHAPGSNSYVVPAMTRKLYELWGVFCPGTPCDILIFQICKDAGKPLPEDSSQILVDHQRSAANISTLGIWLEDRVIPPQGPSMKSTDELVRLFRDAH